ncbi:galactarate dehydratase [Flavilitoribacter nigricans]|uniref:Galactarate dehydratase n=1 Tax=Flavilitoribacter nigricans (strain ATCC 23147 / DSM 23189 / NBRC 102662 / NCIMB 1420 / SS-2) TaxID=1122177 RepID=A0A2D0N5C9_FLAN2|nr:galactarate dehydratase [Flavilitoribacter nigricans]PHN03586.1 galactarate dehydratase [Flavilitoribacter nigricans DSM 23189 = NBRC 102662]
METQRIIHTTEWDNVGIVPQRQGLPKGTTVQDGTVLTEDIPMGHKVALADIPQGEAIIRYGETIGYARENIARGEWVDTLKLELPAPPDLREIRPTVKQQHSLPPLEGYTFEGYRNADGSVGTKNILGIATSVQCVAGITQFIEQKIRRELLPRYPNVDEVVALNHSYGCGVAIDAPAAIVPIRTIQHLGQHPNFGDELMVIGLGCEKLRPERLVSDHPEQDKSEQILYLQDERFRGFSEMVDGIMQMADRRLQQLNRRKRETCAAADLVVGMQCGGSDAFSGLTGNPAAGFAADLIVRAGGTVFFSEVTEVRDAAHLLVPRAADPDVGHKLIAELDWYDDYLARGKADRSANPSPGNKRGGLSTVVEKALGSIAKSGTSPIVDVLGPGEKVRRKGLNFVATPASDFVCGTLQLAAGMNLHVFITGRGTPYGLSMVPVIKVSSNSKLSDRWFDLIDLDAGPIAYGTKTIEEMGWELFHMMLEVASGRMQVASDKLGLYNDLTLFNPGPLT